MNLSIFTERHKRHLRKRLDRVMSCGAVHIQLMDAVEDYQDEFNQVTWYKVTARIPYSLQSVDGSVRERDSTLYEIHVGLQKDRRRFIYTALQLNQGPPWSRNQPYLRNDNESHAGERT